MTYWGQFIRIGLLSGIGMSILALHNENDNTVYSNQQSMELVPSLLVLCARKVNEYAFNVRTNLASLHREIYSRPDVQERAPILLSYCNPKKIMLNAQQYILPGVQNASFIAAQYTEDNRIAAFAVYDGMQEKEIKKYRMRDEPPYFSYEYGSVLLAPSAATIAVHEKNIPCFAHVDQSIKTYTNLLQAVFLNETIIVGIDQQQLKAYDLQTAQHHLIHAGPFINTQRIIALSPHLIGIFCIDSAGTSMTMLDETTSEKITLLSNLSVENPLQYAVAPLKHKIAFVNPTSGINLVQWDTQSTDQLVPMTNVQGGCFSPAEHWLAMIAHNRIQLWYVEKRPFRMMNILVGKEGQSWLGLVSWGNKGLLVHELMSHTVYCIDNTVLATYAWLHGITENAQALE